MKTHEEKMADRIYQKEWRDKNGYTKANNYDPRIRKDLAEFIQKKENEKGMHRETIVGDCDYSRGDNWCY